jgi:hypothetical protein
MNNLLEKQDDERLRQRNESLSPDPPKSSLLSEISKLRSSLESMNAQDVDELNEYIQTIARLRELLRRALPYIDSAPYYGSLTVYEAIEAELAKE